MPRVIPTPFTCDTGKWLDFWHVEVCHIVGEHAGRRARRCTNDLDHTETACWQLNGKKTNYAFLKQLPRLNSRYSHLHNFKRCLPKHIHLFSGSKHLQTSDKKRKEKKIICTGPRSSVFSPMAFFNLPIHSSVYKTFQHSSIHIKFLFMFSSPHFTSCCLATQWTEPLHTISKTHLQTIGEMFLKTAILFDFSIHNDRSWGGGGFLDNIIWK